MSRAGGRDVDMGESCQGWGTKTAAANNNRVDSLDTRGMEAHQKLRVSAQPILPSAIPSRIELHGECDQSALFAGWGIFFKQCLQRTTPSPLVGGHVSGVPKGSHLLGDLPLRLQGGILVAAVCQYPFVDRGRRAG